MKLKLVIGNKIYSTWSLRPWLVLKYFNIPFDEVRINLRDKNAKKNILKFLSKLSSFSKLFYIFVFYFFKKNDKRRTFK